MNDAITITIFVAIAVIACGLAYLVGYAHGEITATDYANRMIRETFAKIQGAIESAKLN